MLDTKSTGSKKFSFIIALILITAASVGYFMMYPVFRERAASYEGDTLSSSEFLSRLYMGSCVLYKDITEAVTGETAEYADLYLKAEEELLEETDYGDKEIFDGSELDVSSYASAQSWELTCRERLNNILLNWRTEVLNGLTKELDYCVIDNATGKSIKNTGREIEKLGTDEAGEEINADYAYYIRVSYGNAGNLERVAVKGKNSEELLKSVQVNLKSNHLWSVFWNGLYYDYGNIYSDGSIYFRDNKGSLGKEKITVSSMPKNVTYIFAITYEQQEKLINNSVLVPSRTYEEWYAYYRAGTVDAMYLFGCVLAVLELLLIRVKKYCLHTLSGVKLHVEIVVFAVFMMVGISENIPTLVYFTNSGRVNEIYLKLEWIPKELYPVLTGIINIGVLFLMFALWYYLITSLGEVFVIGIKAFIRERSLIYKCVAGIGRFFEENTNKFKDEILHMDLGERANKTIWKVVVINFLLLAACCVMWVFGWAALIIYSILLYFGLKKYVQKIQEQYHKLFDATRSIAEGNLQTELEQDWVGAL